MAAFTKLAWHARAVVADGQHAKHPDVVPFFSVFSLYIGVLQGWVVAFRKLHAGVFDDISRWGHDWLVGFRVVERIAFLIFRVDLLWHVF